MGLTKNSGRQKCLVASVLMSFADLTPAGVQAAIDLPVGSIIMSGALTAETAVTGGSLSAATISVGDASSAARYLAATSVFTATNTALVPTGFNTTPTQPAVNITVAFTGGTTPTAGSVRLTVQYFVVGRAELSQG